MLHAAIQVVLYGLLAGLSPLAFAATLAVMPSGRLRAFGFGAGFVGAQILTCSVLVIFGLAATGLSEKSHSGLRAALEVALARSASASLIVPSVLAALAVVIPLGLGGAISPVMLTEQTVLLAGPDGGRAGVRYAAGVVLTTFVIVVGIVLFGRAISLPTKPHLDATLDLVLGLVLVTVAVLVFVLGRRRGGSPSREGGDDHRRASGSRRARAAFPFGVFSMATNVTTLALIAAAAREISRADAETAAVAVLVLVLIGLVSMPAWVPVALTRVAPGPSQRGLAAVRDQIARRGRGFTVGLLSAAGLFFIGRGLIRLLG